MQPTLKPNNTTGAFHTHPNKGTGWYEPHGPKDIFFNDTYAKTNSFVIGRQNVYLQKPYNTSTLLYNNNNFNPYPYFFWFGLTNK